LSIWTQILKAQMRFLVVFCIGFTPSQLLRASGCNSLSFSFDVGIAQSQNDIILMQNSLRQRQILTEYSGVSAGNREYLFVLREGNSDLNVFADYVNKAYHGLRLELDMGLKSLGVYYPSRHSIVMGRAFIEKLARGEALADISTTLRHELVHARISLRTLRGQTTHFDGMLFSGKGFNDSPNKNFYNEGFSFQEFATFGWQVFFHMRQAKKLETRGLAPTTEIKEVDKRIRSFRLFSRRQKKLMPEMKRLVAEGQYELEVIPYRRNFVEVRLKFMEIDADFAFRAPTEFKKFSAIDQQITAIKMFEKVAKNMQVIERIEAKFNEIEQRLREGERASDIDIKRFRKEFQKLVG
jgi:hypothetical protein